LYDLSIFASDGIIVVVAVPEPSRALLFLAGLGMAILRRKRQAAV